MISNEEGDGFYDRNLKSTERIPFPDLNFDANEPSSAWTNAKVWITKLIHIIWISFSILFFALITSWSISGLAGINSAYSGDGKRGEFNAMERDCNITWTDKYEVCSWRGVFKGDDGTVIKNVFLNEDIPVESQSSELRVIWNGDEEAPIFYLDNQKSKSSYIILIFAGWLPAGVVCVYICVRSSRLKKSRLIKLSRK